MRLCTRLALAASLVSTLPAAAQPVPVVATAPGVASPELTARIDRVAEVFRERHARPSRDRWTLFLREGRARVFALDVSAPRCLGFVAVGREGLDDIDLAVSNATGAELVRDDRRDAHPYVRVCTTEPGTLYVRVVAARGNGEATVLAMGDPPLVPPPLDNVLGVRPSSLFGGPRVPRTELGRDPAALSAVEHLTRLTDRLGASGYVATGVLRNGQLPHGQTTQTNLPLQAGRCYIVQGAGGDHVDDLDLRVLGPDRRPLGQDLANDARPAVRLCADTTGDHTVDLRMFSGSGEWALTAMEVPVDTPQRLGADVVGAERARALEVALDASRRGLVPQEGAVRGGAWGGAVTPFAVTLRAGRCYLFGAAGSELVGALDLWLAGEDGAVLGADTNERERAAVYHCARRDARATVQVRLQGGRGEYVFERFESEDER